MSYDWINKFQQIWNYVQKLSLWIQNYLCNKIFEHLILFYQPVHIFPPFTLVTRSESSYITSNWMVSHLFHIESQFFDSTLKVQYKTAQQRKSWSLLPFWMYLTPQGLLKPMGGIWDAWVVLVSFKMQWSNWIPRQKKSQIYHILQLNFVLFWEVTHLFSFF